MGYILKFIPFVFTFKQKIKKRMLINIYRLFIVWYVSSLRTALLIQNLFPIIITFLAHPFVFGVFMCLIVVNFFNCVQNKFLMSKKCIVLNHGKDPFASGYLMWVFMHLLSMQTTPMLSKDISKLVKSKN